MINAVTEFFETLFSTTPAPAQTTGEQALRLATAVLLVETGRADYDVTDAERHAVDDAIRKTFHLSSGETAALVALAETAATRATSYYEFTSLINTRLSAQQKLQIIEYMWLVAYADGILDKYEDHLIRKIADLLYVPHHDFIAAKLRAHASHPPIPAV